MRNMGKSKRYFSNHQDRRSRSPSESSSKNYEKKRHCSSSASKRNSSSYAHHSRSSYDNKFASEKLKKTIQNQMKEASKSDHQKETASMDSRKNKIFIPLAEQVKMMDQIDDIETSSFKPKQFVSVRAANSKDNSINLNDIPLPKDLNSWKENPKILLGPMFLEGDFETRKHKWKENLLYLTSKIIGNQIK